MTSCVLLLVIPSGSGNPWCRLMIVNNSNPPVKYLGVTPPITTDPPKPNDIKSSEALMADLVALNQFESDQERKVRYVALSWKSEDEGLFGCRERLLSNIAQLVAKFVHDVSIKLGMSEKIASEAGGRIYTSGSYRWVNSIYRVQWLT